VTAHPTVFLNSARGVEIAQRLVARAPEGSAVVIKPPRRTLDQNDKLHAMLTDIARQKEWAGAKRDVEAWKDIFTAALRSAQHGLDVVPGLNGGFVLLGMHTSGMSKAEMSDLIELVYAWGAENGVVWTEPEAEAA
jgi:hypothetical protein